ncbi:hypothetical protein PanWU01x14_022810 [Parasponia andersonii]|uniref:Uncharacterized protein n=1 Tax=Parasponia andersonii TaxID=3476 RepID=A0A2P5DXB4_PARAD|nr:hypothetical protein PanWU01x14_022810 [Parasponia andersonii]
MALNLTPYSIVHQVPVPLESSKLRRPPPLEHRSPSSPTRCPERSAVADEGAPLAIAHAHAAQPRGGATEAAADFFHFGWFQLHIATVSCLGKSRIAS